MWCLCVKFPQQSKRISSQKFRKLFTSPVKYKTSFFYFCFFYIKLSLHPLFWARQTSNALRIKTKINFGFWMIETSFLVSLMCLQDILLNMVQQNQNKLPQEYSFSYFRVHLFCTSLDTNFWCINHTFCLCWAAFIV